MRGRHLLWQLFFAYFWIIVAVTVAIGFYAASRIQAIRQDETHSKLEAAARVCAIELASPLADRKDDLSQSRCKELGNSLDVRITVVLPDGKVIADTEADPRDMVSHADRPEIIAALRGEEGRSSRRSSTLDEELMYVALPVRRAGPTPSAGPAPSDGAVIAVIRTAVPLKTLTQTVNLAYREIVAAGLMIVLLVATVSFFVSRRIIRPLDEIRHGAERFARGELKHRLPTSRSEEIAMLAASLNRMAEQLDERIQTILRQQNEHGAVLASMEEGVLAVDRNGVVLSINESCATLLGTSSERVRGRKIYEAIRKPDLLDFIESALASSTPVDGDLRFYGVEEHWLSAHGSALHDAHDKKIGALIVLHDISQLRRLENVRRDFVANVSHELRTPITSIKGFVETLLDEGLEDPTNAMRFLAIVLRQVNRLDAIISDLLLLSRVERGAEDNTIETGPETIAEVLRAAVEMCQKKADGKAIQIFVHCPDDLMAKINAPLLEQAIINLIDNAIQYSETGASVGVEAERNALGIMIRVKDNGCGIALNHQPRLFERFYRVDKARSRELGGTGLGLAIVKHIVTAHQGAVHVESTVGQGSVFSIRLPDLPSDAQTVPESVPANSNPDPLEIAVERIMGHDARP